MNIPLLIFDLICLPITLIRLILIYFNGSRYDVAQLQFLDVMLHAQFKYFNQGQENILVDTIITDVRRSINRASRIDTELLNETIANDFPKYMIRINENDPNVTEENIEKLSQILPNIFEQIARDNHSDIDITKIDDEIKKELDFLSFDTNNSE